VAKRRRKPKLEDPEMVDVSLPALVVDRLVHHKLKLGAMSIGSVIARLTRFYDRVAPSVREEGAELRLLHKDGKWEKIDAEDV
jgi:hypothetical protein